MKIFTNKAAGAALALSLTLGLGGCSDLLDVELPSDLTADALNDPVSAGTQINSTIVLFENALSRFMYIIHGHEDGGEVVLMSPQIGSGEFGYTGTAPQFSAETPTSGPQTGFMGARRFAKDLHEKLDKTWTVAQVPQRARYLAITSLYEGAVYGWMASTLCEGSLDAGPLMTQAQMHALADQTLTRAITEIGAAGGDFAMPFGISSSALNMAYGLRAQNRWMAGDLTGARADAERIPQGFYAYITREATSTRRNLPYYNGPRSRFAALQGVVDWWQSSRRQPNPATGQLWPEVIPFTGYQELGILPDGRATRDDGLPIRLAGDGTIEQKYRTPIENTAVRDPRTPHLIGQVNGRGIAYVGTKFNTSEAQYMPLVNWQEMVLIRAEAEGGAGAIARVNQLRTAAGLPQVTYLAATDAQGIRRMIIEERRRALMFEGRYYYTKLKNLDLLWFPRREGNMPTAGSQYQGGVRLTMPDTEYQLNPNILDLNKRGSGCDAKSKPTF
jgi:hypothetical protein